MLLVDAARCRDSWKGAAAWCPLSNQSFLQEKEGLESIRIVSFDGKRHWQYWMLFDGLIADRFPKWRS